MKKYLLLSLFAITTLGCPAEPMDTKPPTANPIEDQSPDLSDLQTDLQADLPGDMSPDLQIDMPADTTIDLPPQMKWPSLDPPMVTLCGIATTSIQEQVQAIENDLTCIPEFANKLRQNPWHHLGAFYQLISSKKASDALWSHVYEAHRLDRFNFTSDVIDDFHRRLKTNIEQCRDTQRCQDWMERIHAPMLIGELYQCPSDLTAQTIDRLLQSLPYGDYNCTQQTALALRQKVDATQINTVLNQMRTHPTTWGRRNGARTLGHWLEDPNSAPGKAMLNERADQIKARCLEGLNREPKALVLSDLIWILDSFYYPYLEMLTPLERIASSTTHTDTLRFRAIAAYGRLIYSIDGPLEMARLVFIERALASDDKWVRAQAAYIISQLKPNQTTPAQLDTFINALKQRHMTETALVAKYYMAQALDRHTNSTLAQQLQTQYEAQHLGQSATADFITIRSGLPQAQLAPILTRLQYEEQVFFNIMGADYQTPATANDSKPMTLMLFATRAQYQEYMEVFVGFGANAGGLYLEGQKTLYTYERTPQESRYTVEQLIQHEFGHYLLGRYAFPGLWTAPGYHAQAKGWADEGFAEFLGGLILKPNGQYESPIRTEHLDVLCKAPQPSLSALLARKQGYSEAGVFDYTNAWALQYYFYTGPRQIMDNIWRAMRADQYTLTQFDGIAQIPIAQLEQQWHQTIQSWCNGPTRLFGAHTTRRPHALHVPTRNNRGPQPAR